MKPLKIYVGMNSRFVFCEKFPNDEEHAGLQEMFDEIIDNDPFIDEKEPGFYLAHMSVEYSGDGSPDVDSYLNIHKLEKIQ